MNYINSGTQFWALVIGSILLGCKFGVLVGFGLFFYGFSHLPLVKTN